MSTEKKEKPVVKIGSRFGKLTVKSQSSERKNGYIVWRCQCDCGNEILVDKRKLQRGTTLDCGCAEIKGKTDLRGQRFGKLTVLSQTDKHGSAGWYWLCQCDCGNMTESPSRQLLSGYTKSCGCLHNPKIKDFIGKRFGMLTVLEYAGKRSGMHRWRCICDCGNETSVGQTLLQSGKTKSCGCMQKTIYRKNMKLVDGTSVVALENMRHKCIASNTSGQTGVYKVRSRGKWVAQIGFQGKTYYLGAYEEFSKAVIARKQGEKMWEDFLAEYYQTEGLEQISSFDKKIKERA